MAQGASSNPWIDKENTCDQSKTATIEECRIVQYLKQQATKVERTYKKVNKFDDQI